MHLLHLRGRKNCDRVLRQGKRWSGKALAAVWVCGEPKTSATSVAGIYCGTVVPASVDASAVRRNTMRRRCREALRLTLAAWNGPDLPVAQLLLRPRSASLSAPFGDLLQEMGQLLLALSRACPLNPPPSSPASPSSR